jgi:hypothetical protein
LKAKIEIILHLQNINFLIKVLMARKSKIAKANKLKTTFLRSLAD